MSKYFLPKVGLKPTGRSTTISKTDATTITPLR